MILSELNVYPIKSLSGITLREALVEDRGLEHDRRLMLVDESKKFITQREVPQMAAIRTTIDDDALKVSFNGDELRIDAAPKEAVTANVKIWTSSVKALVYDDRTNDWFSDALGVRCRLVLMPDSSKRKVNPFYAVRRFEDTVSFADGYPFMLIGQASLDDLNSRLTSAVPMNRFRPNFVVEGSETFAEDRWKKIAIGETIFHVVKPCARCVMLTIDQSAGVSTGKEPIKTLSTYRNFGGKVHFGQNLIAEKAGGRVRVGEKVRVIETN
ncbi:MAG: MOSC N-terminal beta barrel domain-containing protein [Acidobacteriota bacterium]